MRCAPRHAVLLVIIAIVTALEFSCGRSGDVASQVANSSDGRQVRIVSLSPAISRTLVDFGVENRIVGRTPHCSTLDPAIPVVGDLLNLNYEQLVRLNPTHVLVQPPATGIDPALTRLAEQHDWILGAWRLNGIDDIEAMIREMPVKLFGDNAGELEAATQRSAELVAAVAAALSPGDQPIWHGRVLLFNAVDAPMVFGRETYLHEFLTAFGSENATTANGWARLSMEDVVRLDPEGIIIVEPGASSPEDAMVAAGPLAKLDVDAVRAKRIAVLRHPDAFLPASSIAGVAEELRSILRSFGEKTP